MADTALLCPEICKDLFYLNVNIFILASDYVSQMFQSGMSGQAEWYAKYGINQTFVVRTLVFFCLSVELR